VQKHEKEKYTHHEPAITGRLRRRRHQPPL